VQNVLSSSSQSKDLNNKIYRIIILPVVYGCENWSLTLGEKCTLRLLENRVLSGILGATKDGVTGKLRKLHNEELNDLYCSPNIVRVIKLRRKRWVRHVARRGEESCIEGFGGEPEGKRPLGSPRRRRENNKMDIHGSGMWGRGMDQAGSE
jgi:hypothetical protein